MIDSRSSTAAPEPNSRLRLGALTLLLQPALFVAGCSSGKSPPAPSATASPRPGAPSAAPAAPAAAAAPTHAAAPAASPAATPAGAAPALREEQRWLQSWFEGTPVRIAQSGSNALAVEVPREFCFDAGRSQIKPALAAVLDKVAESLRRQAQNKLTLLAAPADAGASAAVTPAPVATARAAALYKHLRTRGVPAPRLAEPSTTVASAVQLRIEAPPF